MRIAINTRLLILGKLDGIGWFTFETVKRIVCQHPEHDFYFIFDREPDPRFLFADNVTPLVLFPQARHPVLWYLFFEWSVTHALKKYHIDVFLSPDGWMSLRTKVPTLTVIHDLNFEHVDNYLRPSHQQYMKYFFPRFAQHATRVATVSEYSKCDISNTYHVPPYKIDVVYDGSHANYRPYDNATQQNVRDQYTDGAPYFIFIGTIIKRKNLTNTLLAFDRVKSQLRDIEQSSQSTDNECTTTPPMLRADVKLVVVGHKVWWQDELKAAYEGMEFQSDVVFIGRAESEELAQLLSSSIGLVYCSLFEGFGIPILEAFYAETPVITSNCTSMPEVAGDAALLVDPTNVEAIATAMQLLMADESLRKDLIAQGRIQRTKFTWDRTAALLWDSISLTYNKIC